LGALLLLLMIATAFLGYSLVWGQMSFWAVTVITNLFSSLDSIYPGLGTAVVQWLWGGFSVGNPTLNRFFSLHYLLPFVIAAIVGLHIWALHIPGNNNPTGLDVKDVKEETVPFHPYYTIKDGFAIAAFTLIFAWFVFYAPNYLGHPDNYIPANPLATPPHIVPEWYFLPFYAILRAIPSKLGGVIAMFGAIVMIFLAPWLDTSRIRSVRYRPIFKWFFWLFLVACFALGFLGSKAPEGGYLLAARICTAYYFIHFLVVMPIVGWIERPSSDMPGSIAESLGETSKH
jgi:ubiquinol-cytochrome c reductase cytochrome b subunit